MINDTLFEQIMTVRATGKTNMFDVYTVQRIAYDMELYELVTYLESNRKEYAAFISSGNRKTQPELVYICAPLRGDVAANIEKAKQYAREVFLQGDIPICPHIYFTQFASVDDPVEDRTAMDMGLVMLRKCHRVNVYKDPPTEGMRDEIQEAQNCGIPARLICEPEKPALKRTEQVR